MPPCLLQRNPRVQIQAHTRSQYHDAITFPRLPPTISRTFVRWQDLYALLLTSKGHHDKDIWNIQLIIGFPLLCGSIGGKACLISQASS